MPPPSRCQFDKRQRAADGHPQNCDLPGSSHWKCDSDRYRIMPGQQPGDELAAGIHQIPRPGPEAHVDGPPFDVGNGKQFGRQAVEIDEAFAEWPVRAGLIVVQRAVAVDQMNGADAALQFICLLYTSRCV